MTDDQGRIGLRSEFALALLGASLGLCLLPAALHVFAGGLTAGGVRWFDLKETQNLYPWLGSILLGLPAAASLAAAGRARGARAVLWGLAAAALLILSLDHLTGIQGELFLAQGRNFKSTWEGPWRYLSPRHVAEAPLWVACGALVACAFVAGLEASPGARVLALFGLAVCAAGYQCDVLATAGGAMGDSWSNTILLFATEGRWMGALLMAGGVAGHLLSRTGNADDEEVAATPVGRSAAVGLGLSVMAALLLGGVTFGYCANLENKGVAVTQDKPKQNSPTQEKVKELIRRFEPKGEDGELVEVTPKEKADIGALNMYFDVIEDYSQHATKRIKRHAEKSGKGAGQWKDDVKAAAFLKTLQGNYEQGSYFVELPKGVSAVIHMPDGGEQTASHIRLDVNADGSFRRVEPVLKQ